MTIKLSRSLPLEGFDRLAQQRAGLIAGVEYEPFNAKHDSSWTEPIVSAYLVCSTRRSGSTLLCEALGSVGDLGLPAEYLDISTTFLYALAERWKSSTIGGYLRDLGRYRSGWNGVLGVKVHWDQLCDFASYSLGKAESSIDTNIGDAVELVRAIHPTIQLVSITRDDRIAQAVSRLIAERSGVWWDHGRQCDGPRIAPPEYDRAAISDYYHEITRHEHLWRLFFKQVQIEPLRIDYEDLMHEYRGTVQGVARFLGSGARLAEIPEPSIRRQSNELNDRFVTRYKSDLGV